MLYTSYVYKALSTGFALFRGQKTVKKPVFGRKFFLRKIWTHFLWQTAKKQVLQG
jgi:hypothetical protein